MSPMTGLQTLMERIGIVLNLRGQISLSRQDPELQTVAERHHARLIAALRTVEETIQSLNYRPRETVMLAHALRQVMEDISEFARNLGYGLVTMLAGRAIELVAEMGFNPSAAVPGHVIATRALNTLVTAMNRVAHNRMNGDGAEGGLKLLEMIDGQISPVRAVWGEPGARWTNPGTAAMMRVGIFRGE